MALAIGKRQGIDEMSRGRDEMAKSPNPEFERTPVELNSSDALRIASTDERFAEALMRDPEKFAPIFGFSPKEIEMVRRIPDIADLGAQFSYDA